MAHVLAACRGPLRGRGPAVLWALRAGLLGAMVAAGACGGEETAPAGTPSSPLVACLDACTLSCQDEQGGVDPACATACATACFCQDRCRQACRDGDGGFDEACTLGCIARECVTAAVRSRSSWSPGGPGG